MNPLKTDSSVEWCSLSNLNCPRVWCVARLPGKSSQSWRILIRGIVIFFHVSCDPVCDSSHSLHAIYSEPRKRMLTSRFLFGYQPSMSHHRRWHTLIKDASSSLEQPFAHFSLFSFSLGNSVSPGQADLILSLCVR